MPVLSAIRAERVRRTVCARRPIRPSVETTKGVKSRRWSAQGFAYFADFQLLVGLTHLVRWPGQVGFGVGVGDTDIQDAICSPAPKATDQQLLAALVAIGSGCLSAVATGVNFWFVMNSG